jgi:hypothetical protein
VKSGDHGGWLATLANRQIGGIRITGLDAL